MNSATSLDNFEQFLTQLKIQLTDALKQNYLHPYKSHLQTLLQKTKELNTTLLSIPQHNTHCIELRADKHTLRLAPPEITSLQTLTTSYIQKLNFLTRRYDALEQYALQNIELIPYRSFVKEDGTFPHSNHLLFLIPATQTLYNGLELRSTTQNQWRPSHHSPKTLEQTIALVPSNCNILLVENPENLPLVETVEYIILKKYFDKEIR